MDVVNAGGVGNLGRQCCSTSKTMPDDEDQVQRRAGGPTLRTRPRLKDKA